MKVGINLDNYESPMEDTRNLVNNYGYHREIGYLKINPERLPVIVSERRALADIRAMENHKAVYPLHDRRYELIVDDSAISFMVQHKGGFLLFGPWTRFLNGSKNLKRSNSAKTTTATLTRR